MKKVCLINYKVNNISSVSKALKKIDIDFDVVEESNKIKDYSHIILPGIGSFEAGMNQLKKSRCDVELKKTIKKGSQILGICLGMHLLFKNSEESLKNIEGLGILDGNVLSMKVDKKNKVHVPQIGWNNIYPSSNKKHIFNLKDLGSYFYFNHYFVVNQKKKEIVKYFFKHGTNYPAIIQKENILATQFHPEKSKNGLAIFKKFINQS